MPWKKETPMEQRENQFTRYRVLGVSGGEFTKKTDEYLALSERKASEMPGFVLN
jgi:hypothetical protein